MHGGTEVNIEGQMHGCTEGRKKNKYIKNPLSLRPSVPPSLRPSVPPSLRPSDLPTFRPSDPPTLRPSDPPTLRPSDLPTLRPSVPLSLCPSVPPSLIFIPYTKPPACVNISLGKILLQEGYYDCRRRKKTVLRTAG